MDPVYGYQAVNVEAQVRNPSSQLHWMKRMLEVRKQHPVFGTGSFEVISVGEPVGPGLRPDACHEARRAEQRRPRRRLGHRAVRLQPVPLRPARRAAAAALGGQAPIELLGPGAVPADRRAAVLRDPGPLRLLLVRAGRTRPDAGLP